MYLRHDNKQYVFVERYRDEEGRYRTVTMQAGPKMAAALEAYKARLLKRIGGKSITMEPLDKGKMLALYNAGWSFVKIADEMKCAPNTVAYHVHRMVGNE